MEEKEKNNNNSQKVDKTNQNSQNIEKKVQEFPNIEKYSQDNVNHLDIVNKLKELGATNNNGSN